MNMSVTILKGSNSEGYQIVATSRTTPTDDVSGSNDIDVLFYRWLKGKIIHEGFTLDVSDKSKKIELKTRIFEEIQKMKQNLKNKVKDVIVKMKFAEKGEFKCKI